MKIIESIREMHEFSLSEHALSKTIGFVPTMGALHEGHLSLVKRSKSENDITVVSIFVNPTQFGKNEDFGKYPRTFETDCRMLTDEGVDVLFFPSTGEMYPEGFETWVELEKLPEHLCGISRPGHFRGVTTVVAKLFNIVSPNRAYFGQKDYQQSAIIRRMAQDLNLFIDIVVCPIHREADGLAMSSRNRYLSPEDRSRSVALWKALEIGEMTIRNGEKDAARVGETIRQAIIQAVPDAKIDYVSVVDPDSLEDLKTVENSVLIALAVYFKTTRLIDNRLIRF